MRVLLALLLPALSFAGIWPDNFGAFHRTAIQPEALSDRPLWDEYGLRQTEQAQYELEARKFTATAYRMQDSTGAFAAFEWQRPAEAKPSALGKLAVETADTVVVAHGNYLLVFNGYRPAVAEVSGLIQSLPKLEQSPLPVLSTYLPHNQLIRNSERYITGPVGLEKFAPAVQPSVAGFHTGSEVQLGVFRTPGGDLKLAIFSYPTPHIARERAVEFQRISGALVKRLGPLVAVVLSPPDANDAERLLAQVRYEPSITWNERTPTRRDNIGDLIVNAFELIGILLIFCTVAGLSFGGLRVLMRRGRPAGEAEAVISLHLQDR